MLKRVGVQFGVMMLLAFVQSATAQDYPRYRGAASTFVPLDSWVYPALERLVALGYVNTAMTGMKPWTRTECARLVDEARDTMTERIRSDERVHETAAGLHARLEREFLFELEVLGGGRTRSAQVESVYARVLSISGPPLTDGFHFGQTVAYDFGRPFRRGTNAIAGASASATAGPVAIYVRGEYQHAPSAPPLSDAVLDFISDTDRTPRQAAQLFEPVRRGQLLDAYVTVNWKNWQISAGRQSLSWGPGEGSLLLSHNAPPLDMVRVTRVLPMRLPGFLARLGPIRTDNFIARQRGNIFIPNPVLFGQKISFKPTPYLEFGIGRIIQLGGSGSGNPLTLGNFARSYFGAPVRGTVPGDNRAGLDWSFTIPGLDNYVVLYVDGFAEDDHIPYSHPTRSVFRPGIHLTRIPGAARFDLRLEAATSESPGIEFGPQFNYWNFQYRDGHTNEGQLMGNTVGRKGRTLRVWSNYFVSAHQVLQFSFKHSQVSRDFMPGGANWQDYRVRHDWHLRSGLYVRSQLQFERIGRYPLLFPGARSNVTTMIELGFVPERSVAARP